MEELSYALRCADDNRRAQASSLAPVETCLVQGANAEKGGFRKISSELSSDVSVGVHSILVVEQSSLESQSRGCAKIPTLTIGRNRNKRKITDGGNETKHNKRNTREGQHDTRLEDTSSRHLWLMCTRNTFNGFTAAKASLASLRVRSCSSNGPGSESAVAATAVDNANGSARSGGGAALSDPSGGAIVTHAAVLRRPQSNTPHPPLSTSPQPSSPAPLPVLELLSRLQDLLPSEVATEYVRAAGRSYRSLSALSSPGVPTGLDSWIMPHPAKNCGVFGDVDSGKAEAEPILSCASLRSSALEVAIAAAREVLETGAPAAREAEAIAKAFEAQVEAKVTVMLTNAAKVCGGVSPASPILLRSFSFRVCVCGVFCRGRSAMAAARMASEAVAAAVNAAAAAPGVMGESEMLSALAPLLEQIVARQRREWDDVQVRRQRKIPRNLRCSTSRPGKRKLGPAAAKARDDAIVAVMQKMERPIKRAVDVVGGFLRPHAPSEDQPPSRGTTDSRAPLATPSSSTPTCTATAARCSWART
ncbi:unnamed protein product [Ascophyllum nodosum]